MDNKEFKFIDRNLETLKIPKLKTSDANTEVWRFVNLDRHPEYNKLKRYLVSSFGRTYDIKKKRIIF